MIGDFDVIRARVTMALAEVGYDGSVIVDEDPRRPDEASVWFPPNTPDEVRWMAVETARVGLTTPLCFACQTYYTTGPRPDCWATRSFQRDCGRPRDISADATQHGLAASVRETGPGEESTASSSVRPGPVLSSEGQG